MLCAEYEWKWPFGFRENEKMFTTTMTTDNREKFRSFELKIQTTIFFFCIQKFHDIFKRFTKVNLIEDIRCFEAEYGIYLTDETVFKTNFHKCEKRWTFFFIIHVLENAFQCLYGCWSQSTDIPSLEALIPNLYNIYQLICPWKHLLFLYHNHDNQASIYLFFLFFSVFTFFFFFEYLKWGNNNLKGPPIWIHQCNYTYMYKILSSISPDDKILGIFLYCVMIFFFRVKRAFFLYNVQIFTWKLSTIINGLITVSIKSFLNTIFEIFKVALELSFFGLVIIGKKLTT